MNIVARVRKTGMPIAIALLTLVWAGTSGAQETDHPSATEMPALDTPPAASSATERPAQNAEPAPPRSSIAVTRVAYQGYLTDAGGTPIDGTVSIVATLYNAPVGGSSLWTETHGSVAVSDGVFQITLGSITPLEVPDFTGSPVYLGVAVNGEAELPRTQLVASPFAIRAAEADHALTADIASDGVWTVAGSDVYRATGNVGIGSPSPSAKLDVLGPAASGLSLKVDSLLYVNATTPNSSESAGADP